MRGPSWRLAGPFADLAAGRNTASRASARCVGSGTRRQAGSNTARMLRWRTGRPGPAISRNPGPPPPAAPSRRGCNGRSGARPARCRPAGPSASGTAGRPPALGPAPGAAPFRPLEEQLARGIAGRLGVVIVRRDGQPVQAQRVFRLDVQPLARGDERPRLWRGLQMLFLGDATRDEGPEVADVWCRRPTIAWQRRTQTLSCRPHAIQ